MPARDSGTQAPTAASTRSPMSHSGRLCQAYCCGLGQRWPPDPPACLPQWDAEAPAQTCGHAEWAAHGPCSRWVHRSPSASLLPGQSGQKFLEGPEVSDSQWRKVSAGTTLTGGKRNWCPGSRYWTPRASASTSVQRGNQGPCLTARSGHERRKLPGWSPGPRTCTTSPGDGHLCCHRPPCQPPPLNTQDHREVGFPPLGPGGSAL